MKVFFSQKLFYITILLFLLIPVACKAMDSLPGPLRLSKQEGDEVVKYSEVSYAYLGSELSDITEVVRQISDLCGHEKAQGVCELRDHVNAGYKIGRRDAVIAVLIDALVALDGDTKSEKLAVRLKDNIERLQNNELNVEVIQQDLRAWDDQAEENDAVYNQLQAQGIPIVIEEGEVTRDPVIEKVEGCLEVTNDAFIERNLTVGNDLLVKNDLKVYDKAKFKKSVEIDDDLKLKGKLTVSGKAKFKKNAEFKKDVEIGGDLLVDYDLEVFGDTELKDVEIDGNLSIVDDLVVCGAAQFKSSVDILGALTADKYYGDEIELGCNIWMKDTNSPIGNIYKDDVRFIHNFGTDNTFVGKEAGNFTMTGEGNSGFGVKALESNAAGSDNTAVGKNALGENEKGNKNIAIGSNAGMGLTDGDDNIYIGSSAGLATENAAIRIGGLATQTDCFIQGIHGATVDSLTDLPVFVDSDGKLGTITSSKKYKSDITDMGTNSDDLMNLRPIRFTYNHDTSHSPHYGLLAEEVAKIYPELVVHDNSGNVYSVRYHELPAMLLNELQKNREIIKALQSKDSSNQEVIQELQKAIKGLLVRVATLEGFARK